MRVSAITANDHFASACAATTGPARPLLELFGFGLRAITLSTSRDPRIAEIPQIQLTCQFSRSRRSRLPAIGGRIAYLAVLSQRRSNT